VNIRAFGRNEPLFLTMEVKIGFSQSDAGHGPYFGVDLQQQLDILFHGNSEGIDFAGGSPFGVDGASGARRTSSASREPTRGNLNRHCRRGLNCGAGQSSEAAKSPRRQSTMTRTLIPNDSVSDAAPPCILGAKRPAARARCAHRHNSRRAGCNIQAQEEMSFIRSFKSYHVA